MRYWLDGVNLNDPQGRWFPDRDTGVKIAPARRKGGIEYPKVDGVQFIANQPFDCSRVRVSLDVYGPTHEEFMFNTEFIHGLFNQRHKLMEFVHKIDLADESKDRVAMVECIDIDEPRLYANNNARVQALFQVPHVFWRSRDVVTTSSLPISSVSTTFDVGGLEGGNGSISDALIRIKGGLSSAHITDTASGLQIRTTAAIPDGNYLVIDPLNWTARLHTTNSWSLTTGAVWDTKVVPTHGYGSMFTLHPSVDAAALAMRYRVTVSGTNIVGLPTVQFRTKNSYQ